MINITAIKDRGWTDTMIRRLLGAPDEIERIHLGGRRYTTTKRYQLARVETVESTPEWQAWRAKNEKSHAARVAAAYDAADTRRTRELLADPTARQELLPLIHETLRYTATYRGLGAHGYLLTDIRHYSKIVTDHVWISDKLIPEPKIGDQIEIEAWADWYRKGYMGHRESTLEQRDRGTSVDIQLTSVRIVTEPMI
jgi:hypothetical protein